jgi:hypothetical protein
MVAAIVLVVSLPPRANISDTDCPTIDTAPM